MHYAAGPSKHTTGFIHAEGHTKAVQTPPHAYAATKGGHQREYKATTFLQQRQTNFAQPVSSSKVPSIPVKRQYLKADGTPYKSLSAVELCDILKAYIGFRRKQGLSKEWILVLDRDPTHKSKVFLEFCRQEGVKVMLLPARSHDLSPLDSHFFGVAKGRYYRDVQSRGITDWDTKAQRLQQGLKETKADPHINDYELRLQACLKAKGQRFEDELNALKRSHQLMSTDGGGGNKKKRKEGT